MGGGGEEEGGEREGSKGRGGECLHCHETLVAAPTFILQTCTTLFWQRVSSRVPSTDHSSCLTTLLHSLTTLQSQQGQLTQARADFHAIWMGEL